MKDRPTEGELLKWVLRIHERPEALNTLDIIDLKDLSEYLNSKIPELRLDAILMQRHHYPHDYQNWEGDKTKYWMKEGFKYYISNLEWVELAESIDAKIIQIEEGEKANEKLNESKSIPKKKSIQKGKFSALQWGAILYYAIDLERDPNSNLEEAIPKYISENNIQQTFQSIRNNYYSASNRINKKNDYPVNKLEQILPFIKEKYPKALQKVKSDITILIEYNAANQ